MAVMQATFFNKQQQQQQQSQEKVNEQPVKRDYQRREIPRQRTSMSPQLARKEEQQQQQRDQRSEPAAREPAVHFEAPRDWTNIPQAQSLAARRSGSYIDSGLSHGRSFRATFASNGQVVSIGSLQRLSGEGSDKMQTISWQRSVPAIADKETHQQELVKLLEIQLDSTILQTEEQQFEELPYASTSKELRFSAFLTGGDADASIWALGHALFDEVDIKLGGNSSEQSNYILQMKRLAALSAWLERAVSSDIEKELEAKSADSLAARLYTLLTGHQVERACEQALAGGDIRLSTVIAQAGSDEESKDDLALQLEKWRESNVTSQIEPEYRRIYEILSGNVDISQGIKGSSSVDSSQDIYLRQGLSWQRAFGMQLWYQDNDTSIQESFDRYTASIQSSRLTEPTPLYAQAKEQKWHLPDLGSTYDASFELIKLFVDPSVSLEAALSPRAFSASPSEYSKSWHIYQVMAKALEMRDFQDNEESGSSVKAQRLTSSYAEQLEEAGLWQWAVYVLLHIEDYECREKTIRELLSRHVDEMDDEISTFLMEKLRVPGKYLKEAVERSEQA